MFYRFKCDIDFSMFDGAERGPIHADYAFSALFEVSQSASALCVPSNQRCPWGPGGGGKRP